MNLALVFLCFFSSALAETIEEKMERSISPALAKQTKELNTELKALKEELKQAYATEEQIDLKLARIREIREKIESKEKFFKEVSAAAETEEGYGLWDLEETTLSSLVMEYGSTDFLYVIPPEIANMKIYLHSGVQIPRESWGQLLDIILSQNGIGVKTLTPFARQLYILKQNLSAVSAVVSKKEDLKLLDPHARIFFLLSPPVEVSKAVFQFFERFSDERQTFIYHIGTKVAILAPLEEVEKLLTLYESVWQEEKGRVAKVVPVLKMQASAMEKILMHFFGEGPEKLRQAFGRAQQTEKLVTVALDEGNALALIGPEELVQRAELLIKETEDQLSDPYETAVFTYTCRHSDPMALAEMLERVYFSLLSTSGAEGDKKQKPESVEKQKVGYPPQGYPKDFVLPGAPELPTGSNKEKEGKNSGRFIADPKTGGLLMVIRRDAYPKIKELLKQIDLPKKMVQIEVLLFEKQLSTQNNFGLNLLKLGSGSNRVDYSSIAPSTGKGVLDFFFKGHHSRYTPSFELAYSLLMSHDDIQLNAAPCVLTVNQTPAKVAIVEELSINNGAAPVDTSSGKVTYEKTFSRAQYGITIVVTPTIHSPSVEEENEGVRGFITLDTDIQFDTTRAANREDDRPLVDRRSIKNEVRVADGETVIIGGLRRKASNDREEKVPILGEIPGIGRLFGSTKLSKNNTEMFFFITPRIISDAKEEREAMKKEQLSKRPGDIPEFLQKLEEAREKEKEKYLQSNLKLLFGGKVT